VPNGPLIYHIGDNIRKPGNRLSELYFPIFQDLVPDKVRATVPLWKKPSKGMAAIGINTPSIADPRPLVAVH
jgi:hypothetical protein